MTAATPQRPLLRGQAAAPDGPADLSMMYVLHHGFRRDLARFSEAARRTPTADRSTWEALLARWDLFALLLHDHHHKEDEILWPLLRERATAAGDTAAQQVLDEMEAEHATIDPVLERTREGFARLSLADDPAACTALVEALDEVRDDLGGHLDHEERDAIAILQRHVGGAEWAEVERTKFRGGLAPKDVVRMLPWAVEDLPDPVVRQMLAEAGLPFRVMLRLGRRQFARLEAAAFAHVPVGVGA